MIRTPVLGVRAACGVLVAYVPAPLRDDATHDILPFVLFLFFLHAYRTWHQSSRNERRLFIALLFIPFIACMAF